MLNHFILEGRSSERPDSANSIRRSTRQRLHNPSNRRVYTVENALDAKESVSTIDSSNPLTTQETHLIPSPETNGHNQQISATSPLKHLVIKNTHEAVQVRIRCIFLRVGEIDTLNERYYAEILLQASWEDLSLKNLPNQLFDPIIHWTPQLELMNGIGDLKDEIVYTARFNGQGIATITEHHKLKGTLWERMELEYFPLDTQNLSIIITTSRTSKEVIFVKNVSKPSGVNRRVFTDEQEWDLFEHVAIEISEQIDEYIDDGHNHPVVVCSCHAARKYGYFMWNAYFLIFLITSASFTTFPIPLANIQGRIQIACTLLLTSITFRWLCNKALPTISYLTAVDIYAIGSIASLCLLNIYHGVIGYVNYYLSTNLPDSTGAATNVSYIIIIDRWALVVYTILFFIYQICTFIWMYLVPLRKRRILYKKDEEYRLTLTSSYQNPKATFVDVLRGVHSSLRNEHHELSMVTHAKP
ncbi:unnamed protein product [Adineta steineri]|uniref:Neurotransmitter-gated ion-channel ligand-binding domain-containing protein n=1 Tax=Adineta steineri TaxID=433720 RepID=A0A818ZWA6_9BILA|nr:unnamed protein product [Adineta steineri]